VRQVFDEVITMTKFIGEGRLQRMMYWKYSVYHVYAGQEVHR
jgi:hypothetical protein